MHSNFNSLKVKIVQIKYKLFVPNIIFVIVKYFVNIVCNLILLLEISVKNNICLNQNGQTFKFCQTKNTLKSNI